MWGFWDQPHWRPEAAIANGELVFPNKAGIAYQNIYHNVMQTHITIEPERISARADGNLEAIFKFRAHRGEYEMAAFDEDGARINLETEKIAVSEDQVFQF